MTLENLVEWKLKYQMWKPGITDSKWNVQKSVLKVKCSKYSLGILIATANAHYALILF